MRCHSILRKYTPKKPHTPIKTPIFFILLIFLRHTPAAGQNVSLQKNREWIMGTTCALWTGANYYAQYRSPKTPAEYMNFKVPRLDNFSYTTLNKNIAHISDATAFLTCATALVSVTLGKSRSTENKVANSVVMAQSIWISANLAHTVKMIALRARPYTQNVGFRFTRRDDYYSFFSQHSAVVAAAATSAFLLNRRQQNSMSTPGHKWLPYTALALGTTTCMLRIYSGKHYPSDVLCGIVTGIGIAWLNYHIHEK